MMINMCEGKPTQNGKYVCWVNNEYGLPVANTVFLMWINGSWSYPMSAERYRDTVYGFAGPIQKLELTHE